MSIRSGWFAAAVLVIATAGCASRGYSVGGVDIEHGSSRQKLDAAALVRKASPAVGVITTDVARGMGFVIDPRGYMLTNRHVIEDADHVDKVVFPAHDPPLVFGSVRVEYMHPDHDLALLKVTSDAPLPVVPLATPRAVATSGYADIRDPVLLLGRQSDEHIQSLTFHTGEVTQLKARNDAVGPGDFLGLTVAVRKGQSGGPVVDRYGRAIGVVTWTWRDRPGGFAIPIAEAARMLDDRPQPKSTDDYEALAEARATDYLVGLAQAELDRARRITSPSYARQVRGTTLEQFIGSRGPALLSEYTHRLDDIVKIQQNEALFAALQETVESAGSPEFLEATGLHPAVTPAQAVTFFFEYGQAYVVARRFGRREPNDAARIAMQRLYSLDAARSFALAQVINHLESSRLRVEKTEVTPGVYAPRAVVTIVAEDDAVGREAEPRKIALQMRFEWGDWYVAEVQQVDTGASVAWRRRSTQLP
ncbi:MAG: trypsin-like peptidase domain-containing protein [Myxococcales bacterium FL481]|nr:MAG: trypsin-like peptidase domain-containing protein [Myxococcales bacterium FL481]